MDAVEWALFLGILILLLIWLVTKALDVVAPVGDR
jgi:hypothetical protein